MPWHVEFHAAPPLIETWYEGRISAVELMAAVQETFHRVQADGCKRLLGNCTLLEGGHSLFDLYSLVELVLASGMAHELKEAILVPTLPDALEDVRFWETTCRNRGVQVRLFDQRPEALNWLMNGATPRVLSATGI
jgi:hypothetical protein